MKTIQKVKIHNLKVLHWNKVNSLFKNKLDDIFFVLKKYKPYLMSISEANYDNFDNLKIRDYKVEKTD